MQNSQKIIFRLALQFSSKQISQQHQCIVFPQKCFGRNYMLNSSCCSSNAGSADGLSSSSSSSHQQNGVRALHGTTRRAAIITRSTALTQIPITSSLPVDTAAGGVAAGGVLLDNALTRRRTYDIDEDTEPPLPSEVIAMAEEQLTTTIYSAPSVDAALGLFVEHRANLTLDHYSELVDALVKLTFPEKGFSASDAETLLVEARFVALAAELHKCQRRMQMHDLMRLLALFNNINIKIDSLIHVTTLQMLRHHVSNASNVQIMSLHSQLKRRDFIGGLGKALCTALPMLLRERLQYSDRCPHMTAGYLAKGLIMSSETDDADFMEKFLMQLFEDESGILGMSGGLQKYVASALLKMGNIWPAERQVKAGSGQNDCGYYPRVVRDILLNEALQGVTHNIDNVDRSQLIILLEHMKRAYSTGDLCAYSRPLFKTCTARTLKEDWPIEDMAKTVALLMGLSEIDDELVLRLLERLEKSSDQELSAKRLLLTPLMGAIAVARLPADSWDSHRLHALLTRLLDLPERKQHCHIAHLGKHLLCMDYYEPSFYVELISNTTDWLEAGIANKENSSQSATTRFNVAYNFFMIRKYLTLQHRSEPSLQVNDDRAGAAEELLLEHITAAAMDDGGVVVRRYLEEALGAPGCLVTAVYTTNYIPAAYAIVVGEDGQLIPQTAAGGGGGVCTDALCVPPGAKVFAFLRVVNHGIIHDRNDEERYISKIVLSVRLLEAEGLSCVPLPVDGFLLQEENITDKEKIQSVTAVLQKYGVLRSQD